MEIVSGILQFERAFATFSDSFIVIGGRACRAVLSDGPIQPRRTRDIDMVLVLENVGKDFISAFWKFIKEGGYKFVEAKESRPVRRSMVTWREEDFNLTVEALGLTVMGREAVGVMVMTSLLVWGAVVPTGCLVTRTMSGV